MSKMLEFFESNHKADAVAKKANPAYNAWASKWLCGFQHNENGYVWPEFAKKLLAACEAGKMELVKECFWASMMNADVDPCGVPAVVSWGMKRAASISHIQGMYAYLNVTLTVGDIQGESFYGGYPSPTEIDAKLGDYLNKLEIF